MTGPEQRLREALDARAASVTYGDLRPPMPPSAGGSLIRVWYGAAKVAGLLGLAAGLAAVVLLLSDAPEQPPTQVPAPSRTLAPDLPSATPTPSAVPTPSPDVARPKGPEPSAS
ncbi:hypothetical protein ACGH7X_41635 [Streptomyces sp. BBFR51]|uniref:hypothetical protein n=1 Tax=Streptomyces sp. BBFR51 TaxID=3372856 RepID=UPI0037DCDC68